MKPAKVQCHSSPHRRNIVITRQKNWSASGADTAHSVEEALEIASSSEPNNIYVIGGAEIYNTFLPYADAMELTEIDAYFYGQVLFPLWDSNDYTEVSRTRITTQAPSNLNISFVSLVRKKNNDNIIRFT